MSVVHRSPGVMYLWCIAVPVLCVCGASQSRVMYLWCIAVLALCVCGVLEFPVLVLANPRAGARSQLQGNNCLCNIWLYYGNIVSHLGRCPRDAINL